jgi:NAD-dependent deacetylase
VPPDSKRPLDRVLVVTGSGISAESGIPTFRGKDGYWRNLDPTKLATRNAFLADPQLVWDWYRERRALIRRSVPNAAHVAVVQLAQQGRDALVLTQNVDDLHARAEWQGQRLHPDQLVQIHGDIFVTRCMQCDYAAAAKDDETGVPHCPRCGELLRPGVVWFDEELSAVQVARVRRFLAGGDCNVVLVVGTTAGFEYIVQWSEAARGERGRLIEVNPDATPISAFADRMVRQPAATALPAIVAELTRRQR